MVKFIIFGKGSYMQKLDIDEVKPSTGGQDILQIQGGWKI